MRSPAELYDWELAHVTGRTYQDLAFYAGLAARTGGPVLELACGTGRLTVPLDAVGLDIDPGMLARARRRGARRLVCADMRRFALERRFGLVAIPYNSIQLLLAAEDRTACLRSAARHLRPDGVLALEATDFQLGAVRSDVGPQLLAAAEGVALFGSLSHDQASRITTYRHRFQEGGCTWTDALRLRCLNRDELAALAAAAGLRLVEVVDEPPRLLAVAAPG